MPPAQQLRRSRAETCASYQPSVSRLKARTIHEAGRLTRAKTKAILGPPVASLATKAINAFLGGGAISSIELKFDATCRLHIPTPIGLGISLVISLLIRVTDRNLSTLPSLGTCYFVMCLSFLIAIACVAVLDQSEQPRKPVQRSRQPCGCPAAQRDVPTTATTIDDHSDLQ